MSSNDSKYCCRHFIAYALPSVNMWAFWQRWIRTAIFVIFCGCFLSSVEAKNYLTWNKEKNQVDAEIENWDLATLLEKVSKATGWQIYIEPQTEHRISTKFKKLPPLDALSHMLGKLNFALIPQSNAPPKLCVFRTTLGEATQLMAIAREDSEESVIGDELIVTLKAGSGESMEELAKRLGGKITGRIDSLNSAKL